MKCDRKDNLNIDSATVAGFGDEWSRFTQDGDGLDEATRAVVCNDCFEVFPWEKISSDANGADIGCGAEITKMLEDADFVEIKFSDYEPYWSAVAIKA